MKKLALGALFVGLMAACSGGGGGTTTVDLIDSSVIDGMGACNPLGAAGNQGCETGQKCTWINDQDNPPIGHVGCAPDGTLAIGAACTDPPAGPMGYDACALGGVCLSGVCKQICDNQGGTPTCDANHSCTRYADFFESGGMAVAGVCDPACDPLTQDLKVGTNKTACGSAMATMPNSGCYGYDDYSCAPTGMAANLLTDRMAPRTNAAGNPYLNGCAPGFIPLFFEMTGSTMTLCSGFCSALEVDNTTIDGLAPAARDDGNPAALAKMPTDATAVAGHAICSAAYKGSEASSTCRFMWPYLIDDTTGELPVQFDTGIYKDTLGVCMAIGHFQYDSDADMAPDTPYPSCTTLPRRSTATTTDFDDAADWGCQKLDNTMPNFTAAKKPALNPALKDIRFPKQAEVELVRHNLH